MGARRGPVPNKPAPAWDAPRPDQPVRYEPWRPLPRPEQGAPARGIALAVLISVLFWAGLAALL
ncbi:hypothetical protein [Falsiroseomonas ponticola]|uniref:hypothetical protein n=1 Tax=Falsiroseomonas ponticola TaxID=2786951 RepID=UPI0019318D7A|nr:hypothetical protein [Roseomonas ponticola]